MAFRRRGKLKDGATQVSGTLNKKMVIVTGANRGLGFEVAKDFCEKGAKVILACRDEEKAKEAINKIKSEFPDSIVQFKYLDLASIKSVRDFVKNFEEDEAKLDILVNNAGIMGLPQSKTEDGFELHLAVNYLGHFYLTHLLLPIMEKSHGISRIINLTSFLHTRFYGGKIYWGDFNLENNFHCLSAYKQSKLMLLMFSRHLAVLLKNKNIRVYAVDPGMVLTNLIEPLYGVGLYYRIIWQLMMNLLGRSPVVGAQTIIYCAVSADCENDSGKYYQDCRESRPCPDYISPENCKKLYDMSCKMVGCNQHE